MDMGDNVIVINAEQGEADRQQARSAQASSGTPAIPAASRTAPQRQLLDGRFPERVLENAVRRMIPRGPLGRQQLRQPQASTPAPSIRMRPSSPRQLDVASMNSKNVRAE